MLSEVMLVSRGEGESETMYKRRWCEERELKIILFEDHSINLIVLFFVALIYFSTHPFPSSKQNHDDILFL